MKMSALRICVFGLRPPYLMLIETEKRNDGNVAFATDLIIVF